MPHDDWMAPFTDRSDLALVDVTFPGSHDAGLQEATGGFSGYTAVASRDDTICQTYDVAGQLSAGSRAYDLRIANRSGTLRTFHGEGNPLALMGGGWGQDARSIFEQVDDFLAHHTGEIVILRISHSSESDGVHSEVLRSIAPSRRYCSYPQNLATVPLPQLRGKAIVIFDNAALAHANPMNGLHRLAKYGNVSLQEKGMAICGKYAGQFAGTLTGNQRLREMTQVALLAGQAHGEHQRLQSNKHDHLFMIYWQLAWGVKGKSLDQDPPPRDRELSRLRDDLGTHYNLDYLLNAHRGMAWMYHVTHNPKVGSKTKVNHTISERNKAYHRPNWINLDFVNDDVCNKVIEFNNEFLPNP